MHITNPRYFDLFGFHPNIKSAKSAYGSIKYCTKYDENYLEFGNMDAKQELKAKESKKKILGKRLIHDREDICKIILDGNEDLVLDFKKIRENVAAFWAHLGTLKPRCDGFIPNTLGRNRDISLALRILTEKKRHYWFFSTLPDRGKSTFLRSFH